MWSIKVTKWEEAFQTFCWHLVNCWVATPTVKQWNLIGLQIDFWINLFRLFLWNDSSSPQIHLTQKNSKLRNRYFYNDSRFSVNNGLNFNTILTESYHMNFYVLCIQTCLTLATSCLMAECFSFIVVVTTERLYIVQFFRFRFILHIASSALPHIQLWIEHQKLYLPWDGLRQHAIPSYHQLPDLTNRACLVPPQARWAEHTRSWSSTT